MAVRMWAQCLQAYGAFDECAAADRHTILAQACLVIWHLTTGEQGRLLYCTHLEVFVTDTRRQALAAREWDAPIGSIYRRGLDNKGQLGLIFRFGKVWFGITTASSPTIGQPSARHIGASADVVPFCGGVCPA
jgi:hypothetical protein